MFGSANDPNIVIARRKVRWCNGRVTGNPYVCAYAKVLSPEMGLAGTSFRDCGRPYEKHMLSLRDIREGKEHPVLVDVGCRNTVFSAEANSVADDVPRFIAKGVKRLRVELLREDAKRAEALTPRSARVSVP